MTGTGSIFSGLNTSVIWDEGMWAFELAEAFNDLTLETGNETWLNHTQGALEWLRENKMDGNGHYGVFWGRNGPFEGTHHLIELNNMAPVSHAYLDTAATMRALQIPEPASAALLLPAALLLLSRRNASSLRTALA